MTQSRSRTSGTLTGGDRTVLRDLARRVAEAAALPVQQERIALWKRHNALRPVRPMILVFPEGSWRELLPFEQMQCEAPAARKIEHALRMRLYTHEHFADDSVCEDLWVVPKVIHSTGWGLEPQRIPATTPGGAWRFDPVVHGPGDLKKLHPPRIEFDEAASLQDLRDAQDLFGDILRVELRGPGRMTHHLMAMWTKLRGLEEVMIDMYDNPAFLHEAMELLTLGHEQLREQHLAQGLLSLNNDNTYQNSGGVGWTDELPAAGFDGTIRPVDLWSDAEAQEMAQVGPEQHEEFVLRYERRLLEPWGLTGYGCCEDLGRKLDRVKQIRNLRRISISPFADVDVCAPQLGGDYVFSWKPRPTDLVGRFDGDRVRATIRHAIDVCRAHGCVLEMILKDTHTCERQPQRFDQWTRIAREEVERG